jgi:putative ABC transport system permease protein
MFTNYLKVAWRNLLTNKLYAFINISGLAIGLAVCMLIVLYLRHERSFDTFHKNADRICRVQAKLKIGTDSFYLPYMNYAAGPSIKQSEPSIESFLRIREHLQNAIVQNTNTPSLKFGETGFLFADSNFFSFFTFPLRQGAAALVLQQPFSVVISQKAAEKYFGRENPIGRTLRYNSQHDFTITGVAKKTPSNSSIDFDFVASLSSLSAISGEKELLTNNENAFATYFMVKQASHFPRIETGLLQADKTKAFRYIATPLADLHRTAATETGSAKYITTFAFIATLILLLALINYMSLATARATIRAREIGVRKTLGADRKAIAFQFFIESALYTTIAFLLAYILCVQCQHYFFHYLQIDIDNLFVYHPYIVLSFAGLFIITVIVAATYPALVLSAYKPVLVLYGKLNKQSGGVSVRKFFTVFQFSISVALLICALVIGRQLQYFKQANTGVARENIIMLPFSARIGQHYAAFRNDVASLPGIAQTSAALHPMYKGYDMMATKPQNSNDMVLVPTLMVDQHFIPMLNLQWKTVPPDPLFYRNRQAVLLNETAIEKLALGNDALAQKIDDQYEVAGVLKDFHFASLQHKIDALAVFVTTDTDTAALWAKNGGCLFGKINSQAHTAAVIEGLKKIYETYDAECPFDYSFMDAAFDAQYKAEDRLLKIINVFTGFTILIACFGLFGLSAFVIVQRTKEIGIRKVMGASVPDIVALLSTDFLKLVGIAIVIASPVAWYVMEQWLQHFAYRTAIPMQIFVVTAIAVALITVFTVAFQAIKAAIANPVKSLRTE